MKTIVKIVLLAMVMVIVLSFDKDDENLVITTEFQGQEINNIDVGSAFEVRIIKTNSQSDNHIELKVDEKIMPYLKTSLINGALSITLEGKRSFRTNKKHYVDIYTNSFSRVKGSGATDFTVTNTFKHSTLTLLLSGASAFNYTGQINIEGQVTIKASGASEVILGNLTTTNQINIEDKVIIDASGAAEVIFGNLNTSANLLLELSGASTIEMSTIGANFVNADLSGASGLDINQLNVSTGFKYRLSGASDMTIDNGECKSSDAYLKCSGASEYKASGFVVDAMTVELSGASDAHINVLGRITTDDMSDIKWVKNPNTSFMPL